MVYSAFSRVRIEGCAWGPCRLHLPVGSLAGFNPRTSGSSAMSARASRATKSAAWSSCGVRRIGGRRRSRTLVRTEPTLKYRPHRKSSGTSEHVRGARGSSMRPISFTPPRSGFIRILKAGSANDRASAQGKTSCRIRSFDTRSFPTPFGAVLP